VSKHIQSKKTKHIQIMKTNQQIETIEETFSFKRSCHDDIKLELIDHIATEIESVSIESKHLRL
jgi:hypothetical protein